MLRILQNYGKYDVFVALFQIKKNPHSYLRINLCIIPFYVLCKTDLFFLSIEVLYM